MKLFRAYRRLWREAFLAESVLDRFGARLEILIVHTIAIVALILLRVGWEFVR